MLSSVEGLPTLVVSGVVALVVLVFRKEIVKLVDWVVSFKQISKTKEGYALIGATEPERQPPEQPTREIAASATNVTKLPTAEIQTPEPDDGNWLRDLTERKYDLALAHLQTRLQRAPDVDETARLRSFIAHVKFERDHAEGAREFEQVISEFPTKDYPYMWYGLSYGWRDLPGKAIDVLSRGLERADRKAPLWDSLSDMYVRLGDDDSAIEAAKKGVIADPMYSQNYLNLAAVYARTKDVAVAREWYLQALLKSDGSEKVLAAYAAFLADSGLRDEAILRYNHLIGSFPQNTAYRTLLGNQYVEAKLHDLALEQYIVANRLADSKEAWIIGNIGNVYNNRGFHALAMEYLQKAIELAPDSQYAHERLAVAMKKHQEETAKLGEILTKARHALSSSEDPKVPAVPAGKT